MSRNLNAALSKSIAKAAKSDDRFARAEAALAGGKAQPIAPNAPKKTPAEKVVRDTFSFPPEDHAVIDQIRQRLLKQGLVASKSDAVRLALQSAARLADYPLAINFRNLKKLKPGRKS